MIAVEDELPPENVNVLTYNAASNKFDVGYYKHYRHQPGIWVNRYGSFSIIVTHWQHLPDMSGVHRG